MLLDGLKESFNPTSPKANNKNNANFKPEKVPGVDDFLPVFIFVILQANLPNLHSNIEYLSHFRHPSRMLAGM